MTLFLRRWVFAFALGAAFTAAFFLGRGALATTTATTIDACVKHGSGELYIPDTKHPGCKHDDTPISWNQEGPPGQDGQDGMDGQDGQDGMDGQDGQDGADFAGTFTSPNGLFTLTVDDNGARMIGPGSTIRIQPDGVRVEGLLGSLHLLAGDNSLRSSGTLGLSSVGPMTVDGGSVFMNGAGCGLLRNTDVAAFVPMGGGPVLLNPAGTLQFLQTRC